VHSCTRSLLGIGIFCFSPNCHSVSYLGCAEHKRSGCRGRATIPVGGTLSMLKMTQPHNHPPDVNAEEKDAFIRELKNAVRSNSMEKATLKKVYETVAEV
jgi:hypothetical protein